MFASPKTFSSRPWPDPLDRGLVGEWRFDRDTGLFLRDHGAYGLHGNVTGATWAGSEQGPVLYFDGSNDWVEIPGSASGPLNFPATGTYSIEALVYPRAVDSNYHVLVSKGDGDANDQWNLQIASSDNWEFVINDGGQWLWVEYGAVQDAWVHLIGVRDGANMRLYVDGILRDDTVGDWPGGGRSEAANVHIGSWTDHAGKFSGDVALIRGYDRALTDADALARFKIVTARRMQIGAPHLWRVLWGVRGVVGPTNYEVSVSLSRAIGIESSASAAVGGGVSLSRAAGIVEGGQAVTLADASLTRAAALSMLGVSDAVAAIALGRATGLSSTGQAVTLAAVILGKAAGISTSGVSDAAAALALGRIIELSASGASDAAAALALSRVAQLSSTGQAVTLAAVSLARIAELSTTGVLDFAVALVLNRIVELSASGASDAAATLALGRTAGISTSGASDAAAALILTSALGMDASALVAAVASLGLTYQQAITLLGEAVEIARTLGFVATVEALQSDISMLENLMGNISVTETLLGGVDVTDIGD